MQPWERLDRKTLVDTPFLKVYSDKVRLPNGSLIDDYTVVKKRDIVIIVATDENNKLITFKEYKYAVNKMLLTLPAGQIDKGESAKEAAERELLEETGYSGEDFEVIDILNEYPTKDLHTLTIVRARNVHLTSTVHHEETENIGDIQLMTINELQSSIKNGDWTSTGALAGLMVGLPELLGND